MKWLEWEGCLLSEDRHVLKVTNVNQIPSAKFGYVFPGGFTKGEYLAKIISRALYADPYKTASNYNVKNEEIGITFESGYNETVINEKTLKKFMQKSSKFYLGKNNCPLLIVNKNYAVLIAPACQGDKIKDLEV